MKKIIFILLFVLGLPSLAFASVRVNEIAWMGTSISSSNEWIELYNDSDISADLSGFTLAAEGAGRLSISLSGSISPKGFFLLERTNDDAVSGVLADQIYTGALSNSGETLVLKDMSGSELQKINASSGWPAGDNTTKETMQWKDGSWGTAQATPRAENGSLGVERGGEDKTVPQSVGGTVSSSVSAHASPLPLSDFSEQEEFSLSAGRDRITPSGGILVFEGYARDSKGKKLENTLFSWTFGDGLSGSGSKISHEYEYPGNYIVVLNAVYQDVKAVARANVRVFVPEMTLSEEEGFVPTLTNHSSYEINIGGWKLRRGGQIHTFPEDTIIGSKEKVGFSFETTTFQIPFEEIELLLPGGKRIASFKKEKNEKFFAVATTTEDFSLPKVSFHNPVYIGPDVEISQKIKKEPTPEALSGAVKKTRNVASYQYAAAIDTEKETSSSTKESETVSQRITIKKREGFFAKLWDFFF